MSGLFSAERGFPSLLAPELSRLWTAERVKPGTRKPAAERPLLLGLLSHYFPDLDKNAIDAKIALRKTLAAEQIKESIFAEGDAYKQLEDLLDQGDAEAVQEHLESAGYGRASGSGDRPPPRVPMADLGVTDPAPHMSQAWASEFIPKRVGCTISEDVLWHFRWVGQYREKATPPYYFPGLGRRMMSTVSRRHWRLCSSNYGLLIWTKSKTNHARSTCTTCQLLKHRLRPTHRCNACLDECQSMAVISLMQRSSSVQTTGTISCRQLALERFSSFKLNVFPLHSRSNSLDMLVVCFVLPYMEKKPKKTNSCYDINIVCQTAVLILNIGAVGGGGGWSRLFYLARFFTNGWMNGCIDRSTDEWMDE